MIYTHTACHADSEFKIHVFVGVVTGLTQQEGWVWLLLSVPAQRPLVWTNTVVLYVLVPHDGGWHK